MQPQVLTTRRLILDQPSDHDVDAIAEACQDAVFEHFMTLPWPYLRTDAEYFVASLVPDGWASGDEASWSIRLSDEPDRLLGMVSVRKPAADLGYWLSPDARGHGYMLEAVERVVAWARENRFAGAGPVRWSGIAGNTASASVARRAGFIYLREAPSPVPLRDGSRPPAWLAEFTGVGNPGSWPVETFAEGSPTP